MSMSELVSIPAPDATQHHSYYKFYAFIPPEKLAAGWSRDRIVRELQSLCLDVELIQEHEIDPDEVAAGVDAIVGAD